MLEIHFSQRFLNIAYFKVHFEVSKIRLLFFSYRSLLLSTSILNDTNEIYGTAQLTLDTRMSVSHWGSTFSK